MSHDDRHIACYPDPYENRHVACYPDPHEIGTWVVSIADDHGEIQTLASRHGTDAKDLAWARAQRYGESYGLSARLYSDGDWR